MNEMSIDQIENYPTNSILQFPPHYHSQIEMEVEIKWKISE